jgi:hypothetical protein
MDESQIEYTVNLKSKSKFLCLPDRFQDDIEDPDGSSLLINPNGVKALFSNSLFEPKYYSIGLEDQETLSHFFNAEQIQTFKDHILTSVAPVPKKQIKPGLPSVEWSAKRLIFYRPAIDALKPNESFQVHVESEGTFEFTKSQFEEVFDHILETVSWDLGVYSYSKTPKKALDYLKIKKSA